MKSNKTKKIISRKLFQYGFEVEQDRSFSFERKEPILETYLRAIPKVAFQFFILFQFALSSLLVTLIVRNLMQRRKIHSRLVQFSSILFLKAFSVKLNVINSPNLSERNHLIVSNHSGFIDIFILGSQIPSLFITSVEIKETLGLGALTEMGGCLYVERRKHGNLQQEVASIREVLQHGINVILFPEALSTPGDRIYPFKRALMMATAGAGTEILPAVINFRKINGKPMGPQWRDYVFWHGSMTFVSAAWKALSLRSIEVDLEFLTPIVCHSENERRGVALKAQKMIEFKYVPIPFI